MNNIVAVVVTYNRKDLLRGCIESLINQQDASCDVLIIDNASTDGTYEFISDLVDDDRVKYKNTGDNLGGAGGFAIGMEMAVRLGYEYIWVMDDDTYPDVHSLYKLVEADRCLQGNYGFLSSIAKWTDGSICNMNIQRISLKKKITDYKTQYSPVIMATFVAFWIKAEEIRKVGLPISEFFIWADDLEYSRRISMSKPCYAVTDSIVIHKMGSNNKVGIEQEAPERLWRYKYLYRNEVFVYRREGIKGYMYLFTRVLFHMFKTLFRAKDAKVEKLSIIYKSFRSGFKFDPSIRFVKD